MANVLVEPEPKGRPEGSHHALRFGQKIRLINQQAWGTHGATGRGNLHKGVRRS
jgi:hypothetical protein